MRFLLYLIRRGLLLAITAVVACGAPREVHHENTGWYRAVVSSADGVSVAFLVELPAPPGGKARFRSGSYAFEADATVSGGIVRITMPLYGSTIVVTRAGRDLVGTVELFTPFGGHVSLRLTATPAPGPDVGNLRASSVFPARPLELGDQLSYWRIEFDSGSVGKLTLARVSSDGYEGVLALDNGNITNLGGVGDGGRLVLSGFDGTAAYQLDVTFLTGYQEGRATWVAGQALDWREAVRLRRSTNFELHATVAVTGPLGLPELLQFAGKPLLVEIGASWCSTCGAAAPVLRSLYEKYHSQGLEVTTLLYEYSNDIVYDQQQALKFKQAYDIPWPVVAVTGEPGEKLPSGLDKVETAAFPLLLVLSRDQVVRSVRAGFPMDMREEAYRVAVEQLRSSVESVVKE